MIIFRWTSLLALIGAVAAVLAEPAVAERGLLEKRQSYRIQGKVLRCSSSSSTAVAKCHNAIDMLQWLDSRRCELWSM